MSDPSPAGEKASHGIWRLVTAFAPCLLALQPGCRNTAVQPTGKPLEPPAFFLERSRAEATSKVEWEKVRAWTFDSPEEINGCLMPEGRWAVEKGALVAVEGEGNRIILLTPSGIDPVKVEFDVVLHPLPDGRVGDISTMFNAPAAQTRVFANSAYSLTTVSFYNHATTCYRIGKPLARTEYSPVVPRKRYHMTAEFTHGHLRYWLDGVILLDAWDRDPIPMSPEGWIGLRTWNTRMEVDNFTLFRGRTAP